MNISDKHQKAIDDLVPKDEQQAFLDRAIELGLKDYEASHAEVVEVYVDGGSRGNPGPAGGGFAIYRGGALAHKGSEFFGEQTNNQAEYLGLRLALRETYDKFPDLAVKCFMDSELVVKQMTGEYRVKDQKLRPIFDEIQRIADQFKSFSITAIPRDQNKMADRMANEAMDRE